MGSGQNCQPSRLRRAVTHAHQEKARLAEEARSSISFSALQPLDSGRSVTAFPCVPGNFLFPSPRGKSPNSVCKSS